MGEGEFELVADGAIISHEGFDFRDSTILKHFTSHRVRFKAHTDIEVVALRITRLYGRVANNHVSSGLAKLYRSFSTNDTITLLRNESGFYRYQGELVNCC